MLSSCGDESIRTVESFQPISPFLHKCSRNNDSPHHHPREMRRYQQRKRYNNIIYSSMLFSTTKEKEGSNDQDTEIISSRVLQDQGPLSPIGAFLSSLPSIPFSISKPVNFNDEEVRFLTIDIFKWNLIILSFCCGNLISILSIIPLLYIVGQTEHERLD